MSVTTRTIPGDRRCPNCLKLVRPVHFSANGTIRCQHDKRLDRRAV